MFKFKDILVCIFKIIGTWAYDILQINPFKNLQLLAVLLLSHYDLYFEKVVFTCLAIFSSFIRKMLNHA